MFSRSTLAVVAVSLLLAAVAYGQEPGNRTATSSLPGVLIAAFSGAVGGSLIAAVATSLRARRDRQLDHLRQQLQQLYGPLYHYMNTNARVQMHDAELSNVYANSYSGEKATMFFERLGQEGFSKELREASDVMNDFAGLWRQNNLKAAQVIENNLHLTEPDDQEAFGQFVLHVVRYAIEIDSDGKVRIPDGMILDAPKLSLFDREWARYVEGKFLRKRADYQNRLNSWL